jgi:hypothetical protein
VPANITTGLPEDTARFFHGLGHPGAIGAQHLREARQRLRQRMGAGFVGVDQKDRERHCFYI